MTEIRASRKKLKHDPPVKVCLNCRAEAPAASQECGFCGMHFRNHPSFREAEIGNAMVRAMKAEFGFFEVDTAQ
jgi:ribosomal protein L40E